MATHGRSLYKTNVAVFKDYDTFKNAPLHIAEIPAVKHSKNWGSTWSKWLEPYEPYITLQLYTSSETKATITILSDNKKELQQFTSQLDKGFNTIGYDLTITKKGKDNLEKGNNDLKISKQKNEKFYLPKGNYTIDISTKTAQKSVSLVIE